MKLILHIGTAKTGTTTLQHWFASNRESLRSQGIYYPQTLGQANHRKLSIFAMNPEKPDDGFYQNKIFSVADHQIFKSNLIQDFEQEYAENSQIKTWVISSEHLQSRLSNIKMINQVKQFLSDKFEEIEILVHLRPQVDVVVSRASTANRGGKIVDSSWFLREKNNNNYYNYNQLIEKWETIFDDSKITILPFKTNPSMTDYLVNRLNINTKNTTSVNRKNEAIDWRTMAVSNIILGHQRNKEKWKDYHKFIKNLPCTEKLSIGLKFAQEFQSKFQSSNSKLIDRFQELNSNDLTPDWNKYNIPENLHYLDMYPVFSEPLNALVTGLNLEIKIERCSTNLAECEVALAQSKLNRARQLLEKAQSIILEIPEDEAINSRLEPIIQRIKCLNQQVQ